VVCAVRGNALHTRTEGETGCRAESASGTKRSAGFRDRRGAREAEGAPLLREYRVKSSIEGSNPSLSAINTSGAARPACVYVVSGGWTTPLGSTNRPESRFVQRSCPKGEAHGCTEQHPSFSATDASAVADVTQSVHQQDAFRPQLLHSGLTKIASTLIIPLLRARSSAG
jgi:hypothetical protein